MLWIDLVSDHLVIVNHLYFVQTVRIGADEEVDDMQGLKPEEINKRIQEKEAKAHAQILEMVSNVVSICKLKCLNIVS